MHILYTTPADNTEIRRYSKLDAPSASSVALHIWGRPPKPGPFAAVMSWLTTSIVEGLAAYGETICPYLVDVPDPHARHHQPRSVAPPPAREGITVLARWLAWFRPQPRPDHAAPESQREALDDSTQRDLGVPPIHPDDIDRYLERYLDHGGW